LCLNGGMKSQEDARHLNQDQQELLRVKAVDMVFSGKKQVEVAGLLGVHKDTISRWVRTARAKGKKSLLKKKRGAQKECRLNAQQSRWICKQIEEKHPEQLKLPFALWTREAIAALIQQKYGLVIPLRTLTDYLKRWGFTPQKPARQAIEQKPEAVQKWLEEEYPAIEAKAKAENGLIYWGDEMGLRSDHQAGRSFSPKGKTPVVPVSGNRFGCNMISALTNRGQLAFSVFEGSFVVAIFLAFLQRLIKHAKGRKVFLIVDGHPVHRAKAIKEWLKDKQKSIELFYLPGYSPDRNPDELLNQELKATVYETGRPKNKIDLKRKLKAKLYSIQKQPHKVRAYFQKPSVYYAAG
jgi:transposase